MDDNDRLSCIIILILIALAALFALTETAYSAASRTKIKTSADRGDQRAVRAASILERFDRAITTLLICTNIVHICAATMVTVLVTRYFGLSAVTLSTFITTIVVFFAAEMLPKSIARKAPEKYALGTAGILSFLMYVFTPLSAVLSRLGQGLAGLIKGDPELTVTEDEIYDIIEDMAEEGSIDEEQEDLISSVLGFGDVRVGSILTPREEIVAIDAGLPAEEIFDMVKGSTHSRIPVYRGSIDNIIGMLRIRKYMKEYLKTRTCPSLRPLLDKVYYAGMYESADELLGKMTSRRLNMAVIRGERGRTLGIVTVEDILEEIVGEVYDETDKAPAAAESPRPAEAAQKGGRS